MTTVKKVSEPHYYSLLCLRRYPMKKCSERLLKIQDVMEICKVSRSKWNKMYSQGMTPEKIKMGKSIRWLYSDILEWLTSGCPSRKNS